MRDYQNPELPWLQEIIRQDAESSAKKNVQTASRYYSNCNDICRRKRQYVGDSGLLMEAENLSNAKLAHPFFAKLVNQKIAYLLSKPFSIKADNEAFGKVLEAYFGKKFTRTLKRVGIEAILSGCGWLHVYFDASGRLAFARIPSEELTPLWADGDHTELLAMIRSYREASTESQDDARLVEYWTAKSCLRFQLKHGKLTPLESRGHAKIQTVEGELDADFGRIPFVPFRYNPREIPLINYVKELIDAYDLATSDIANDIRDTPNAIKIIRGYGKTPLGEFNRNLATYRAVKIQDDGSVEQLETHLDTTACEAHLARLRHDIYDAACGVDAQQAAQENTSGVAIRLRYADLDMDCQSMAAEFSSALEELLYFVKIDAQRTGKGSFGTEENVEFVFNMDISVNEAEAIQMCVQSRDLLSRRTLLSNHPWVSSIDEELTALDEDAYGSDAQGHFDEGEVSPFGAMSQAPYAPTPSERLDVKLNVKAEDREA